MPSPSHCVLEARSGAGAHLLRAAPPGFWGGSVCAIPSRYDQTHPKMLILTMFYKIKCSLQKKETLKKKLSTCKTVGNENDVFFHLFC